MLLASLVTKKPDKFFNPNMNLVGHPDPSEEPDRPERSCLIQFKLSVGPESRMALFQEWRGGWRLTL